MVTCYSKQIIGPHLDLLIQELWSWGLLICFHKPSRGSWCTVKFENHGYKGTLCNINLHLLITIFGFHILEILSFLLFFLWHLRNSDKEMVPGPKVVDAEKYTEKACPYIPWLNSQGFGKSITWHYFLWWSISLLKDILLSLFASCHLFNLPTSYVNKI